MSLDTDPIVREAWKHKSGPVPVSGNFQKNVIFSHFLGEKTLSEDLWIPMEDKLKRLERGDPYAEARFPDSTGS